MQASSYQLEELLPHRPPMVLIDEIVSCDIENQSIIASVKITPQWSQSWVAIELMAQTAAALAGVSDRSSGYTGAPKPGFLLGTRKMECLISEFEVGKNYTISSKCVFKDGEAASFECAIFDGENEVARATLNAYRPSEINEFIKEQQT